MQEELRTARDFVLAARSAVRIADKRAAIAACDAACDAACAILHRISQQQSAPAEARVPEAEDEQAAPAPAAVMLLPAPAIGGESSGVAGEGAPRWQRPEDPAMRAQLVKSSSTSTSDVEPPLAGRRAATQPDRPLRVERTPAVADVEARLRVVVERHAGVERPVDVLRVRRPQHAVDVEAVALRSVWARREHEVVPLGVVGLHEGPRVGRRAKLAAAVAVGEAVGIDAVREELVHVSY